MLGLDIAGAAPGTVLTATLQVRSHSGRRPLIEIPVTLVVPGYQTAINSGTSQSAVDALGDTWSADRKHATGSYGYLGSASQLTTSRTITGAADPALYRTARQGTYEYRFDGLPAGTYRIELGFAELSSARPTDRLRCDGRGDAAGAQSRPGTGGGCPYGP